MSNYFDLLLLLCLREARFVTAEAYCSVFAMSVISLSRCPGISPEPTWTRPHSGRVNYIHAPPINMDSSQCGRVHYTHTPVEASNDCGQSLSLALQLFITLPIQSVTFCRLPMFLITNHDHLYSSNASLYFLLMLHYFF